MAPIVTLPGMPLVPKGVPLITTSELKILAPAKVCSPVVTTPPLVASAGAKLSTPEDRVAPLGLEEGPIGPKLVASPLFAAYSA